MILYPEHDVTPACSKDKTRPQIGGVCVTRDSIVAADGRIALRCSVNEGLDEPVTYEKELAVKPSQTGDAVRQDGEMLVVGRKIVRKLPDDHQDFPNVAKFWPKYQEPVEVTVDAKALKKVADYFARHTDGRTGKDFRVKLRFEKDGDPLEFEAVSKNGYKMRGLVMPMKEWL